ncbi:hypothetical protein PI124_g8953 [Phytophthora idaei]|nr:hypothetical protein PI124_g8953 [Phytophthora idaei]
MKHAFLERTPAEAGTVAAEVAQLFRQSSLSRTVVMPSGPTGRSITSTLRDLVGKVARNRRLNDAAMDAGLWHVSKYSTNCYAVDAVSVSDEKIFFPNYFSNLKALHQSHFRVARAQGTPDIPEKTRQAIALYLAERSVNGRTKRGAASAAAKLFGCCRQQASKFYKERFRGLPTAKRGRPQAPVDTVHIAGRIARVSATPHHRRQTLRALAHAAYIPKTTLLRYISKQYVKHVTVRTKPTLSVEHKRKRLAYAWGI